MVLLFLNLWRNSTRHGGSWHAAHIGRRDHVSPTIPTRSGGTGARPRAWRSPICSWATVVLVAGALAAATEVQARRPPTSISQSIVTPFALTAMPSGSYWLLSMRGKWGRGRFRPQAIRPRNGCGISQLWTGSRPSRSRRGGGKAHRVAIDNRDCRRDRRLVQRAEARVSPRLPGEGWPTWCCAADDEPWRYSLRDQFDRPPPADSIVTLRARAADVKAMQKQPARSLVLLVRLLWDAGDPATATPVLNVAQRRSPMISGSASSWVT